MSKEFNFDLFCLRNFRRPFTHFFKKLYLKFHHSFIIGIIYWIDNHYEPKLKEMKKSILFIALVMLVSSGAMAQDQLQTRDKKQDKVQIHTPAVDQQADQDKDLVQIRQKDQLQDPDKDQLQTRKQDQIHQTDAAIMEDQDKDQLQIRQKDQLQDPDKDQLQTRKQDQIHQTDVSIMEDQDKDQLQIRKQDQLQDPDQDQLKTQDRIKLQTGVSAKSARPAGSSMKAASASGVRRPQSASGTAAMAKGVTRSGRGPRR